jgi:hypothetical protein
MKDNTNVTAGAEQVHIAVESFHTTINGVPLFVKKGAKFRGQVVAQHPLFFTPDGGTDAEVAHARRELARVLEEAALLRKVELQRAREREARKALTPVVRMARALKRIPIAVGPRHAVLEVGDELPVDDPVVLAHREDFAPVPVEPEHDDE